MSIIVLLRSRGIELWSVLLRLVHSGREPEHSILLESTHHREDLSSMGHLVTLASTALFNMVVLLCS
jgi:hypothetical protein